MCSLSQEETLSKSSLTDWPGELEEPNQSPHQNSCLDITPSPWHSRVSYFWQTWAFTGASQSNQLSTRTNFGVNTPPARRRDGVTGSQNSVPWHRCDHKAERRISKDLCVILAEQTTPAVTCTLGTVSEEKTLSQDSDMKALPSAQQTGHTGARQNGFTPRKFPISATRDHLPSLATGLGMAYFQRKHPIRLNPGNNLYVYIGLSFQDVLVKEITTFKMKKSINPTHSLYFKNPECRGEGWLSSRSWLPFATQPQQDLGPGRFLTGKNLLERASGAWACPSFSASSQFHGNPTGNPRPLGQWGK